MIEIHHEMAMNAQINRQIYLGRKNTKRRSYDQGQTFSNTNGEQT